jgi:hypothetical protein
MPRYKIYIQENHYTTYEVETDLTDEQEVEDYFNSLTGQEQNKLIVNEECYLWEIDEIKRMESKDAATR